MLYSDCTCDKIHEDGVRLSKSVSLMYELLLSLHNYMFSKLTGVKNDRGRENRPINALFREVLEDTDDDEDDEEKEEEELITEAVEDEHVANDKSHIATTSTGDY